MVRPYISSLSCRESSLQLLSRRDHGQYELAQKLKSKGYPESEIDEAIEYCDRLGYIDDQRFAQGLVRRNVLKGHGVLWIKQELQQKQISSDIIELVMAEAEVDWFELARETAQRKYDLTLKADQKLKAKQIRFLQYRGFSFEQIKYALSHQ